MSVVAVTDLPESYDYPHEVRFEIPERDLPAYRLAADFLNLNNADVLCVQHEFGIFGGQAGNYLLATLNEATCHAKNRVHGGPQDDHISAYTVLLSQALQAQPVSFPLFPQRFVWTSGPNSARRALSLLGNWVCYGITPSTMPGTAEHGRSTSWWLLG